MGRINYARYRIRAGIVASVLLSIGSSALASPTFTPLYWFKDSGQVQGQNWGALAFSDNTLYGASLGNEVFRLFPPAADEAFWTLTVLHKLSGGDGDSPYGGLLLAPAGLNKPAQHIFGTTQNPGGTIFELSAPAGTAKNWAFSVLHAFSESTPDRANMFSGVIADTLVPGRLIGVAPLGGAHSYGTVFTLTPPTKTGGKWTETVLTNFNIKNGLSPEGGLLQDDDGTLYGTTKAGGTRSYGTVFQLSPPAKAGGKWTLRTLYNFTGQQDGGHPASSLTFDPSHQHVFGVASIAVTGQQGSVYRLTRPATAAGKWIYTRIHSFVQDGTDGTQDNDDGVPGTSVVIDKKGNLYGATASGGSGALGTVYELAKPSTENGTWTETILHAFTGKDGGYPYAALTMGASGELYGTTTYGGPSSAHGGVFKVVP